MTNEFMTSKMVMFTRKTSIKKISLRFTFQVISELREQ